MAYFARGANIARAMLLLPFTSFVGPMLFFFLRKDRFICTFCRGLLPVEAPVGLLDAFSPHTTMVLADGYGDPNSPDLDGERQAAVLEGKGRIAGVRCWVTGFASAGLLAAGVAAQSPDMGPLLGLSGFMGLSALFFAWRSHGLGKLAAGRRRRTRAIRILELARLHRGRLNVTLVASHLGLELAEAERTLDGLVDGQRIDMHVDDDGRITYVFPELLAAMPGT